MGARNYSATSNNMNGTLAVEGWAVTFGTAMKGLVGAAARPDSCCTKCNSPPINGQCANHVFLYNDPLLCGFTVPTKGLNRVQ